MIWIGWLLLVVSICHPLSAQVCGSGSNETDPSKWVTIGGEIVEDIVGFISGIGPWAAAALDILNLLSQSQSTDYTIDIAACVKYLVKQEIEQDIIDQTNNFLEEWTPVFSEWKDAPLTSNTTKTKEQLAVDLYEMAVSEPLSHLPLPEVKKETVFPLWFDVVHTILFAFESTAVQFAASPEYGNGSSETCNVTIIAKNYAINLFNLTEEKLTIPLISCPFYQRESGDQIGWNCLTEECLLDGQPYNLAHNYWLYDLYIKPNNRPDNDPVKWCTNGKCNTNFIPNLDCDNLGSCKRCYPSFFGYCYCHKDYDGRCDKVVSDYKEEVKDQVNKMKSHVNKMMEWMKSRIGIMETQIKQWCKSE